MLLPLKVILFPVFFLYCWKCNFVIDRLMHWSQSPAGQRKGIPTLLILKLPLPSLFPEGKFSWQFQINYTQFFLYTFADTCFCEDTTSYQAQTRWDWMLCIPVWAQKPTCSFRVRITRTAHGSAWVSLGAWQDFPLQESWQLSEGVNTNIFILSHRNKWLSLLSVRMHNGLE